MSPDRITPQILYYGGKPLWLALDPVISWDSNLFSAHWQTFNGPEEQNAILMAEMLVSEAMQFQDFFPHIK
ncbi:MAG: hypothetical protein V1871_03850 [Planctomycetota bacterium]